MTTLRAFAGRVLRYLRIVRIEADDDIPRWRHFLIAAAVGGIGSTVAGIALPGFGQDLDASHEIVRILTWLALGVAAGLEAPSPAGLAGLVVGTFVAFLAWELRNSPSFNQLWGDLVVTAFGLPVLLAPGWAIGMYLDGRRRRPAPDVNPWQPWDVKSLRRSDPAPAPDEQRPDADSRGGS
jgi:hypothetical protein